MHPVTHTSNTDRILPITRVVAGVENYIRVTQAAQLAFRGLGFFLLAIGLLGMAYPQILTATWPWSLIALTAHVLAGWLTRKQRRQGKD